MVSLDNGDLLLIIRHGKLIDDDDEEDDLEGVDEEIEAGSELHWQTLHFVFFRVNFPQWRLERLTTLGDRSIFVGCKQSLSLWAPNYPGLRPNCIYFTNSDFYGLYREDCGIFDLDTDTISSVSYPYTPPNLHPNVQLPKGGNMGWKELFWLAPPLLQQ